MSDEIEHDKPDAITRLRDENERLRAALRKIASNNQQRSNCFCGACIQARAARAALEGRRRDD